MTAGLTIRVDEIRAALTSVLDAVERKYGSLLDFGHDYYWALPVEASFDMTNATPALTVGQISDDIASVGNLDRAHEVGSGRRGTNSPTSSAYSERSRLSTFPESSRSSTVPDVSKGSVRAAHSVGEEGAQSFARRNSPGQRGWRQMERLPLARQAAGRAPKSAHVALSSVSRRQTAIGESSLA